MSSRSLLRRPNVESRSSRGHAQASTRSQGTRLEPQTSSVPLITEADVAERISATVTGFSAKQLAKATRKSLEATKAWKNGERCPNTANTINMARNYPSVWAWLAEECGHGERDAQACSADAVIRWAAANRNAPGQDGHIARLVLRGAAEAPE